MRIIPVYLFILSLLCSFVANGNDSELIRVKAKPLCTALSMFKMDQRRWPTSEEGLNVLTFPSLNDYGESGSPYIKVIEKDLWGNDYIYKQHKKRFKLISMGRDGVINSSDDIGPNICYPDWTE